MKYAWVCAHCGTEAIYTNVRTMVQYNKTPECPKCHNNLIIGSAYLRSALKEKSPQIATKQPEGKDQTFPPGQETLISAAKLPSGL